MAFFVTSDNKAIEKGNTFEMGGGNFEPIPSNTQLKSMIDEAKWDEYDGDRYISLRWTVLEGEFTNRKIYQKVKVNDADPKKKDRQLNMLAAIDSNAGGALMAAGVEPDDMALSINLMNKPMAICVDVWEINDKKGNWVKAVSPLKNATAPAPAKQVDDFGDDIPF
jgi:hypothetical protein